MTVAKTCTSAIPTGTCLPSQGVKKQVLKFRLGIHIPLPSPGLTGQELWWLDVHVHGYVVGKRHSHL